HASAVRTIASLVAARQRMTKPSAGIMKTKLRIRLNSRPVSYEKSFNLHRTLLPHVANHLAIIKEQPKDAHRPQSPRRAVGFFFERILKCAHVSTPSFASSSPRKARPPLSTR